MLPIVGTHLPFDQIMPELHVPVSHDAWFTADCPVDLVEGP